MLGLKVCSRVFCVVRVWCLGVSVVNYVWFCSCVVGVGVWGVVMVGVGIWLRVVGVCGALFLFCKKFVSF